MQRIAPPKEPASRREELFTLAAALAVVSLVAGMLVWIWYPTTLQPAVTLTSTPFVATSCAPVLGGYANEYNTTITLVNSGRADGDTWVQFLLGNVSLGYRDYTVRLGSQVTDNASITWEVHASPTQCGPLDIPGAPAVALASVTRLPPIDERALLYATANPIATLGGMAALLGYLSLLARRHGISLLRDMYGYGWALALLVLFAAYAFDGVVVAVLTIPYNYPVDWTLLLVYGPLYATIIIATTLGARRLVLKAASRDRPPPT